MPLLGFLIGSLPFILPLRDYPDGDFYSDALAVILALCLVVVAGRRIALSWIGSGLFSFVLLGAVLGGEKGYYYQGWLVPLVVVFILGVFFSVLAGQERVDRQRFLDGCLWGVLVGGCYTTFIGYSQMFDVVDCISFLVFPGGGDVYGNFGQRNNFSTYLLVFSIVVSGFSAQRRVNIWFSAFVLVAVAVLLAYAGSRMVMVAVLLIMLVALVLGRLRGWCSSEVALVSNYALFVCFLSVCLLVFWFFDAGGSSRISIAVDTPRLQEWAKAWRIFLDHPLGVGYGNYAHYSFLYQFESGQAAKITWSHAHNIFFHLLVEFGVWIFPLLIVAFWGVLITLRTCLMYGVDGLVAAVITLFFVVHSQLEYPLWYMNFLVLLLTVLAVYSPGWKVLSTGALRWGAAGCLVVVLWVTYLYVAMPGYRNLSNDMHVNLQRMETLVGLSLNPALDWPADKVLLEYLVVDDGPEWEYKMCKSIFMASREPLYPYLERIALLALARQDFDFASMVLKSRYAVYPDLPDDYLTANIRWLWPERADAYLEKIALERELGFPDHQPYKLTVPNFCDSYR